MVLVAFMAISSGFIVVESLRLINCSSESRSTAMPVSVAEHAQPDALVAIGIGVYMALTVTYDML